MTDDDDAAHRFWCLEPLLVARHKRRGCGRIVALYTGHVEPCPDCPPDDARGWTRVGRCRCAPAPVLPHGDELAALIEKARSRRTLVAQRNRADDAPLTVSI